jgi:hypothetical protein
MVCRSWPSLRRTVRRGYDRRGAQQALTSGRRRQRHLEHGMGLRRADKVFGRSVRRHPHRSPKNETCHRTRQTWTDDVPEHHPRVLVRQLDGGERIAATTTEHCSLAGRSQIADPVRVAHAVRRHKPLTTVALEQVDRVRPRLARPPATHRQQHDRPQPKTVTEYEGDGAASRSHHHFVNPSVHWPTAPAPRPAGWRGLAIARDRVDAAIAR